MAYDGYDSNGANGGSAYKTRNYDYVEIYGDMYTPASLEGWITVQRDDVFDQPMLARPVVSEADRSIRPERLTATERESMDYSYYQFDDSVGERRFKTEFDYYTALMRAVQANVDRVLVLKRKTAAMLRYVSSEYTQLYDEARMRYGADMGKNDGDRRAWFRREYPALVKCRDILEGFLDEIGIEEDRLKQFSQSTSRMITSTESSFAAQGKLWNLRG